MTATLWQALISAGADASKPGGDSRTPFQHALANGHAGTADFLRSLNLAEEGEELCGPQEAESVQVKTTVLIPEEADHPGYWHVLFWLDCHDTHAYTCIRSLLFTLWNVSGMLPSKQVLTSGVAHLRS